MDFRKNFELHRYEVSNDIERQRNSGGLKLGYFYALMNIAKELNSLVGPKKAEETWINYLAFLRTVDDHKKTPYSFLEWDEVSGREHLQSTLQEGGAFLTFHYGFVRHNMVTIGQEIRKGYYRGGLPFYLVAEKNTVSQEKQLDKWESIRKYSRAELLNSQDELIGLKLYSHLKKGGCFSLFVDGQTGFNTDNYSLELPFLTSKIKTRSGIFRILARAKKPVCLYFMTMTEDYKSKIVFLPPFEASNDIQHMAEQVYTPFRNQLMLQPEQWRFWDRHHAQVLSWENEGIYNPHGEKTQLDWISKPIGGFGQLGMNLQQSLVYSLS
ncbi:LpxL/LpxP family acyltransferase [Paenibacillus sp. An7]|uniref:LpxL/LpxP family acyltransferase n=1 Tax=Paenibacillus sp. An7 TaxID=2689577 RepID=UPI001359B5C9|nr:hypothetical protein [Paenibacillus sp. An7]